MINTAATKKEQNRLNETVIDWAKKLANKPMNLKDVSQNDTGGGEKGVIRGKLVTASAQV